MYVLFEISHNSVCPGEEPSRKMKVLLIFLAIELAAGEKLGLGYLPPPGAQLSGGSPGDIKGPFAPPDPFNIQPSNGQYTQPDFGRNNFVIGSPQKILTGNIDTFAPDKIPTTTTTYAFSQTTTYPEGYETTVVPIDPVTGLPIQSLDQTNFPGQLSYGQSDPNIPIYGNQIPSQASQYGNKAVTIGTPNYGTNNNQPLNQYSNQKGNVPVTEQTVRYPNGQYQYGDKLPQYQGQNIIRPGNQQGYTTLAPVGTTEASIIPTDQYNSYNINQGSPEILSEGSYSGSPIQVQETNAQPNQPSYNTQKQVSQDIYYPSGNINTARPFQGTNQDAYKPGSSNQYNGLPISTSSSDIPSFTPSYSSMSPINRPDRPQAASDRNAIILNYENIRTPNGYSYSYDTSNGIHGDETGVVDDGTKAQGKYSYIGDDGKVYSVSYTADENGFRPYGDHLPTPPPVPEAIQKVIEQAARDKASGIVDDGSYDEAKYGHKKYQGKERQRPQQQNQEHKYGQSNYNKYAGGRKPDESVIENNVGQGNPNGSGNNVIYGTNQPFTPVDDKKSLLQAPGGIIGETNRQQFNQQKPFNVHKEINIIPSDGINYPGNINQNSGYGKTRPGTNAIGTSSAPGNLGYTDNNSNQYSTQTPEFNQYQQYEGQPQFLQNYNQEPYNYNGKSELQSRPQFQNIGNNPSSQQNENGYYYQAPNAVLNGNQFLSTTSPQGNSNDQTRLVTVNAPIRQPTLGPDTKFNAQYPNNNGYTTYDQFKPKLTGTSPANQPQITDVSRKPTIPFGQKIRYTQGGNVSPPRKNNIGSYTSDSTSPMTPKIQNLQKTDDGRFVNNNQQPFVSTGSSTTGRPIKISEYTTQTPTYTTGYPTESYGIRGSPGYTPSFSTTPGYSNTYKSNSQRPGYSTTKAPSTTGYYSDQTPQFQGSFPNDSKYQYTPGQLQYSTSSPTTARPSAFGTSRIPVYTTKPYGSEYQSIPGGYTTANNIIYPSGNIIVPQSQTPGFSQIRPLAPDTTITVIPGANQYGFSESPYAFGMKYGNGPQIYSSTTSSPIGTSSFSPVTQPGGSNQGYYTQTSTSRPINTFVDAFGRPVTPESVSFNGITSSPGVFSSPAGPFGTSPVSFNTGDSNLGPEKGQNYDQGKVIGEDFSGPKQPQRFDPETGYHY